MDVNNEFACFITIKNQKENFLNHPKVRLINPAAINKLEKMSETIFDNRNKTLFEATKINQLKNTVSAIK